MTRLPCPFCGGQPSFSNAHSYDDNRYQRMTLECCSTMSTGIGYGEFRKMTKNEIEAALKADLCNQWNTRYEVSE